MGMTQQSHNLETKTISASSTIYPAPPFPPAQLAAATRPAIQNDLGSLGPHVGRVDEKPATMKELLTDRLKEVTTIMALEPTAAAAASPRLFAIHMQLASSPEKHGVPFQTSSQELLRPRKGLKATPDSSASAVVAKLSVSASPPSFLPPSALILAPESPFHERWKCISANSIC